ncbi:hypothetical protein S40293_06522 [Stachybotrys chartarum IBT 40293]|nr:hypothetical protein S40293_06522 [Stachybotrys chartarum IBT 40293]
MRRYTARASALTVSGLGSQARRWRSYDREELTPEALRIQLESGLGNDVYAQSLKLNPEEKTITTASGDLPVSPVLDPAWMKARRGRQEAKRKPKELLGNLRKKTASNPYVRALATPYRVCSQTGVGLPRYFLQDMEVVQHPTTGTPWWAPGPLATEFLIPSRRPAEAAEDNSTFKYSMAELVEQSDASKNAEQTDETTLSHEGNPNLKVEDPTKDLLTEAKSGHRPTAAVSRSDSVETISSEDASISAQISKSLEDQPWRPSRAPLTKYVLSRKTLLEKIGAPPQKLLPRMLAMRNGMASIVQPNSVTWRPDMSDVILTSLRRMLVDVLVLRTTDRDRPKINKHRFVTPVAAWEDVKSVKTRGCVLWLPKEGEEGGKGPYTTFDVEGAKYGKKMAVHDLRRLLGDEELERLKRESEMFKESEILVMSYWPSASVRSLHLLLWRLQGYLA